MSSHHSINNDKRPIGFFEAIGAIVSSIFNIFTFFMMALFVGFVILMIQMGNSILGMPNLYWIFSIGIFLVSFLRLQLGTASKAQVKIYIWCIVFYALAPLALLSIGFSGELGQPSNSVNYVDYVDVVKLEAVIQLCTKVIILGIGILSPLCSLYVFYTPRKGNKF